MILFLYVPHILLFQILEYYYLNITGTAREEFSREILERILSSLASGYNLNIK